MSLSVTNLMAGGSKPNALYCWGKYSASGGNGTFTVASRSSASDGITLSSSDVDLSKFTLADFDGATSDYAIGTTYSGSGTFEYADSTLKFNYTLSSGTSGSIEFTSYNAITHTLSIVALRTDFTFSNCKTVLHIGSFIEYITDKNSNTYPNGEVHTDGYFYRYAMEGLYAWEKSSISYEKKLVGKSVVDLPYSFRYGSAVVYNNEIHIMGTSDSSCSRYHYKWNGTSWVSVSTLPHGFYWGSAVVYNNEIHILGSNDYQTRHYKWNGTSWTSVSTLPYSFSCGSAVVWNDEIHIMGANSNSTLSDGTYYYQAHYKWNGSEWTKDTNLPYFFYYGSAVVWNDEIHILGSYGSPNYQYHYKWNGTSWTSVSTLPFPLLRGSAVVYDNEIHILGSSNSAYYTCHYKWNGTSWTSVSTLPYAYYGGSAIVHNDSLYIMGTAYSTNYNFYIIIENTQVYELIDTIVSDNENAYPDKEVQDGYYYEKIDGSASPFEGWSVIGSSDIVLTSDSKTLSGIEYDGNPMGILIYCLEHVTDGDNTWYSDISGYYYYISSCLLSKYRTSASDYFYGGGNGGYSGSSEPYEMYAQSISKTGFGFNAVYAFGSSVVSSCRFKGGRTYRAIVYGY